MDGPELTRLFRQRRAGQTLQADVYVHCPEEATVRRLSPGNGVYYQPCIRPDGRKVVYAGADLGPPRLWEADVADGTRRPLTPEGSAALHPVYSWDGTRIAYVSDAAGDAPHVRVAELNTGGRPKRPQVFHVWVCDADGSNPERLTDGRWVDLRPTFSPDGAHVVFVSNRGRRADRLWRVPVPPAQDAGRATPASSTTQAYSEPELLYGDERVYRPWFSADGASIFCHTLGDRVQHHPLRIPLNGDPPVRLAPGAFERAHGSFADPDGASVLVHAEHDGIWNIWEIPLEGDAPPRVISIPGFPQAYHATRARGRLAFDLPRGYSRLRELRRCVRFLR